jgi:hypothetical protein
VAEQRAHGARRRELVMQNKALLARIAELEARARQAAENTGQLFAAAVARSEGDRRSARRWPPAVLRRSCGGPPTGLHSMPICCAKEPLDWAALEDWTVRWRRHLDRVTRPGRQLEVLHGREPTGAADSVSPRKRPSSSDIITGLASLTRRASPSTSSIARSPEHLRDWGKTRPMAAKRAKPRLTYRLELGRGLPQRGRQR